MLIATRCRVSRETRWRDRVDTQQARRRSYARMHVHWSCTTVKSRIWQVHLRQHQDQYDKKQQRHQREQPPRIDRPVLHAREGNTNFNGVNPHQRAIRLRGRLVEREPRQKSGTGNKCAGPGETPSTPHAKRSCWRHPGSVHSNAWKLLASKDSSVPPRPRCDCLERSQSRVLHQTVHHLECWLQPVHP